MSATPKYCQFASALRFLISEAVTQKFAFLARSGAGKTYAAGVNVEAMLAAHHQVVVFDPVGVWWGLQLAADGKSPGFKIPVFGGEQGNLPLYPDAGPMVARTIVEKNTSAVLDVSHFRKNERVQFMTSFGEEFFQLKKKHRSPVHLVLEEAQTFCPQFIKGVERMVGTMEDIIKLGRNYGIGVSLISQRPQAVNKDVLNQAEVLVVLQTTGPQERKTIKGWIVEQGLDMQKVVDELPGLGRTRKGEAYFWSPSWLGVTQRIFISKKTTYDASQTPSASVRKRVAKALDPKDIEELKVSMAEFVKRQEDTDPTKLKVKVRELEARLAKAPTGLPATTKVKTKIVEVKRPSQKLVKTLEKFMGDLPRIEKAAQSFLNTHAEFVSQGRTLLNQIQEPKFDVIMTAKTDPKYKGAKMEITDVEILGPHKPLPNALWDGTKKDASLHKRMKQAEEGKGNYIPTGGAKRMLEWLKRAGPTMSRRKIALLSRMKLSGGSFGTYLSALKTANLITLNGDTIILNQAGEECVPNVRPIPPDQLISTWAQEFTGGARRMFDFLVDNDRWVTRQELGSETNMDVSGGSFGTYLSALKTAGVIELSDNQVRLHPDLRAGG